MTDKTNSKRSTKTDRDIAAIIQALQPFGSDGASLEQVIANAGLTISERTIMRRLATMVDRGLITKTGRSRSTRYTLVDSQNEPAEPQTRPPTIQPDLFVPLSKAGGDVLRQVSAPPIRRKPVGYDRAFLDNYRPNSTTYLTDTQRRKLHDIGKTTVPNEPAGTHAQQILSRLLIDLSWNSSRLEGNTYSLLDTQRLILAGEEADEKAPLEAQMILNHKAAIEFLVQSAPDIGFNRFTILNLHALLAENLLPDPAAAGRIRSIPVSIGQSTFMPLEIPQLLEEYLDQILATATAITDPFEQAIFVMVQLPYLQPFEDVNKRVSRLAANIPLIRHNLAPLSFVDVPDHTYTRGIMGVYELNRIELLRDVFLWAYERSAARYAAIRQTLGEPDPFRLRHREALKGIVKHVVSSNMSQKDAAIYIAQWATENMESDQRARLIEVAESELLSLHEGNFARYQIRPSQFQEWQEVWKLVAARSQ